MTRRTHTTLPDGTRSRTAYIKAAAAFGIPTGDAFLVFGHAVEVDFLGALHNPVLEDVVASPGDVALGPEISPAPKISRK